MPITVASRRPSRSALLAPAAVLASAAMLAAAPGHATAFLPQLSAAEVRQALDEGAAGIAREEFGDEWRIRLASGEEIAVTTPYSRLAHAARQAAFRGEALTEKQREEQLDRGKGKIQFLVTMYGREADFARWYQPVLKVGGREVKATFAQNERTPLRLEDGRFAARNVYVFPAEGLPPRGTVVLVIQRSTDRRVVLEAPVDLSKLR